MKESKHLKKEQKREKESEKNCNLHCEVKTQCLESTFLSHNVPLDTLFSFFILSNNIITPYLVQ